MLSCWIVLNTLMNSVFRSAWWRTHIPEIKYLFSHFKIHSALTVWSLNLLWCVFETTECMPDSGVCIAKTNRLILCVDIILVYFESLMKHKLLCGKNFFFMLKQVVHIHAISAVNWTIQGLSFSRGMRFFFSKTSRPALGHPKTQIQVGVGSFLPGGITVGAWIWPLPSNSKVTNEWRSTSTSPICLYGVHRDSFAFTCMHCRHLSHRFWGLQKWGVGLWCSGT